MKRFVTKLSVKVTTPIAVLAIILSTTFGTSSVAKADSSREFILSCSYGVLAGTLVGAATLAFADKPGDNLNKVARGASFGLYGGILLGLYVVYGVQGAGSDDAALRERYGQREPLKMPSFLIAPLISARGVEGGEFKYEVTRF